MLLEKSRGTFVQHSKSTPHWPWTGTFALSVTINPLVKRFESGERTEELYDEIMELE